MTFSGRTKKEDRRERTFLRQRAKQKQKALETIIRKLLKIIDLLKALDF